MDAVSGNFQWPKLYPGVYQDYEQGMFHFLQSVYKPVYKQIKHYSRTVLLFSTNMRNYELITGLRKFFYSV